MNTTLNKTVEEKTLTTAVGRHDHPPEPTGAQKSHSRRRVRLLDRAALHLGVALIKWSRRPSEISREQLAAMAEGERVKRELERERELFLATHLPRRIM